MWSRSCIVTSSGCLRRRTGIKNVLASGNPISRNQDTRSSPALGKALQTNEDVRVTFLVCASTKKEPR